MKKRNYEQQKGAALVMVLMIILLLSIAGIGLLLSSSMNTANVTDAIAEQQAYYAAQSGIQSAINVLRRNSTPNPLIDASKPATDSSNKIDYAKAVKLNTSNSPDDPSSTARLSRWLNYNYTPPGAEYPDRVTLGSENYHPFTGSAFSVKVEDPDNPTKIIALTTSASIGGGGDSKTYLGLGTATIKYNSVTTGNLDVSTREAGISLGSFTISTLGVGATILDTPFEITVKMTAPLTATIKLRGMIKGGTISSTSVGNVKIVFDSPLSSLLGSIITLPTATIIPNAPNVNGGVTNLDVTVTLSQPRRLVILATGYGPRGARKVIEAIVQRDNFDGLIPATVTLVGSTTGSIFKSSNSSSQWVTYSGSDVLSNAKIPPIGVIDSGGSGGSLLSGVLGNLTGAVCTGCVINGNPAEISADETPEFLKSTTDLDSKINELRELAKESGRYYSGGTTPPNFGNNADGTGITFIDGDGTLSGAGGGILVATGKLTLDSSFNFNGTIFVTGEGGVNRVGSGTGVIQGNMIIAPYKTNNLVAGFLPPKYDITGGTVSNIAYSASNLLFGSDNYNTVVVGIVEK
ncbi:MAG: pilus assembly PilX N-terminal domain-containing protein [Pyrinomonadaceae bacterium]|nr:pilus assembly PilX N-terminal domain-containing protein [Pyrinomonadaceae bacterium]